MGYVSVVFRGRSARSVAGHARLRPSEFVRWRSEGLGKSKTADGSLVRGGIGIGTIRKKNRKSDESPNFSAV